MRAPDPFCQHSSLCFRKASDRSLSPGQSLHILAPNHPAHRGRARWPSRTASPAPLLAACSGQTAGLAFALWPTELLSSQNFRVHNRIALCQSLKRLFFSPVDKSLEFKAFPDLTATSIQQGHLPPPPQGRACWSPVLSITHTSPLCC